MKKWIQLSPYGNFAHPLGHQTITRKDAEYCIKNSCTLLFRLNIHKIPVYIGHPDDAQFQNHPDHMNPTVYGWVKHFLANDTGLWVTIRWTKSGQELVENKIYNFLSPRWALNQDKLGNHHPYKLISVGLTTHPNLPVHPINDITPSHFHNLRESETRSKKLAVLHFAQKIQQRMATTGESYPEAWQVIHNENKLVY